MAKDYRVTVDQSLKPESRSVPLWIGGAVLLSTLFITCGDLAPTAPASLTPGPSFGPRTITLIAALRSGLSELGNPATAGETSCTGTALVMLDPDPRPPLGLAVAYFDVSVRNCPPGTTVTTMEIHRGPRIGTQTDAWIGSGLQELVLANGSGHATVTARGVPLSRAEAVVAQPTEFRIHFHSKNNPVGFMGGDLQPR